MVGLIDGSLSTLAPIFSVAIVSHKPLYAFAAGLATSIGAAISMAFSEGLSDTGELTGRGSPADARLDHRRRDVPRRDPAHAAVPAAELPRGDRHRDRRRRASSSSGSPGSAGGSSRRASSSRSGSSASPAPSSPSSALSSAPASRASAGSGGCPAAAVRARPGVGAPAASARSAATDSVTAGRRLRRRARCSQYALLAGASR